MGLVDRLLVHAKAGAVTTWAGAIPHTMLDVWWARGESAKTYALLDLIPNAGISRATFAALDRDPDRAREQALIALGEADMHSIEPIATTVPRRDPVVLERAIQASRRLVRRDSLLGRVIHPELDLPAIDTLANDELHGRLLVAWAATRVPPELQHATLARAWAMAGSEISGILPATRELGAWQLVPEEHRGEAARMLALDGDLSIVMRWVAEATEPHRREQIMSGAALDSARIPAEWVEPLRALAASANEQYEEGLIIESELAAREWAATICDGRDAVDARAAAAFVAAHAAATVWLHALGAPSEPKDYRARVTRAIESVRKAKGRIYGLLRVLTTAGAAGDREAVRAGIDEVEGVVGPLTSETTGGAAALAYYPGRALEIAAALESYASADTRAHVALGLAADGHLEQAHAHAAIALDHDPRMLDPALAGALARFVFQHQPDARERLLAFVTDSLAQLPGSTLDAATAWVADPCAAPAEVAIAAARSPELEARLADDEASALVYADWLLAHGDPRGELITLHHAGKLAEADALIARHRDHFLGGLARCDAAIAWRHGFIDTARLVNHPRTSPAGAPTAAEALALLLDHPSGAVVRELLIPFDVVADGGMCDFHAAIAILEARAPQTLRRLRLGEFRHSGPRNGDNDLEHEISWTRFGELGELWSRLPRLEALTLQGCFPEPTLGSIDIPALRELAIISGGIAGDNTRAIASVTRPNLEILELWFGSPDYGFSGGLDDLLPLLDPRKLPRLHTLRLMNASFTDALIEPLARSGLLPQLREVGLALGTLTDDGATTLAHHRAAFAHLAVLDLDNNCLSDDAWDLVSELATDVYFGDQKNPATERYVSVGE